MIIECTTTQGKKIYFTPSSVLFFVVDHKSTGIYFKNGRVNDVIDDLSYLNIKSKSRENING